MEVLHQHLPPKVLTAGTPCPPPAPFPHSSPHYTSQATSKPFSIASQLPPTPPAVPLFPQPCVCDPRGGQSLFPGIFSSHPTSAKAVELEGC